MHSSTRIPSTLLVLTALLLAAPTSGQVPDGHYVASSAFHPTAPGSAGLFYVHPRAAGIVSSVTGLPAALTGAWQAGNGASGPNCVLRRRDGSLLVGDIQPVGQPCSIHLLQLNGNAVATSSSIAVGTASGPFVHGGIQKMGSLPNGDVVFCAWGLQSTPPLNGAALGVLSLAGPTALITPVPWTPPSGSIANSLAVGPTGEVYVGVAHLPGRTGEVHHVDPISGASTVVAQLPEAVMSMACDPNRSGASGTDLVVGVSSGSASGTNRILRLYHNLFLGGTLSWPVTSMMSPPNALVLEAATGAVCVASSTDNQGGGQNRVGWMTPLGVLSPLASAPSAGWSVLTGIDIDPNPETYDAGSTVVQNNLFLEVPAGPMSLPTVGNPWFAFESVVVPAPTYCIFGFGRAQPPVAIPGSSAALLVAAPAAVQYVPLIPHHFAGSATASVAFPIPNSNGLAGLQVNVQLLQLTATIEASHGVEFTIL